MNEIALSIFMTCIANTIPNPHTINHLPDEQRKVIIDYAEIKCRAEADEYLMDINVGDPNCGEVIDCG